MPGSEGLDSGRADVFNIAAKDGTVIATSPSSMLLAEAVNSSSARFDSRKFGWIGTVAPMTDVLAVFKSSGINTLQDAKTREVVIGATGTLRWRSLARSPLWQTRCSGPDFASSRVTLAASTVNLAMERGEIQGRTNQWASWKVLRPEWIKNRQLSYLLQYWSARAGTGIRERADARRVGEGPAGQGDRQSSGDRAVCRRSGVSRAARLCRRSAFPFCGNAFSRRTMQDSDFVNQDENTESRPEPPQMRTRFEAEPGSTAMTNRGRRCPGHESEAEIELTLRNEDVLTCP